MKDDGPCDSKVYQDKKTYCETLRLISPKNGCKFRIYFKYFITSVINSLFLLYS